MPYGIRIEGLNEVRTMLGQDFAPALRTAIKAIALEVEDKMAPYPPATIANSPSNPSGRWYERGYGQRWRTKRGTGGRATSQMMNRGWSVAPYGATGWVLGNRATYSGYLHSKATQVSWASSRGWQTDLASLDAVAQSGAIQRILTQAIMAKLRR
jgi:hypothetical protein